MERNNMLDFCDLLDLFDLTGDNESGSEFEYGGGELGRYKQYQRINKKFYSYFYKY